MTTEKENSLLPAGNYAGTIVDYGVNRTRAGDPRAVVIFKIDGHEGLYYWGKNLSGKQLEYALKDLVNMGLRHAEDIPKLSDRLPSGVLDTKPVYNLTVEITDSQPDSEGKTKKVNAISWVNVMANEAFKMAKPDLAKAVEANKMGAVLKNILKEKGLLKDEAFGGQSSQNDIPF